MIEVELRGFLTKSKYDTLHTLLKRASHSYEHDDKIAYFYAFKDGIVKAVNDISKKQYRISIKHGNEFASNGMDEQDIYFENERALNDSMATLEALGFKRESTVNQTRVNYRYKGVEIALKYTESWSYHFEIEKVISKQSEISDTKKYLMSICQELGLEPLGEAALERFVNSLRK